MSPHEVGLVLDFNQPVERYGRASVEEVEKMLEARKRKAPVVNGKQTRWL